MTRKWQIDNKTVVIRCNLIVSIFQLITLTIIQTSAKHTIRNRQKIYTVNHEKPLKQKVLLISIDGFGVDITNKTAMPNLEKIKKQGVSTDYVMNVFPTKTLPNHQSIVTGLYPENHGIVDNDFLDPTNGRIFHGEADTKWWNSTTPIWTENQKVGYKSGVMCWPGYRVRYENRKPDYLSDSECDEEHEDDRNKTLSLMQRLKKVISWLKHDDVTFVGFYTGDIDEAGHDYGPHEDADRYIKAIKRIDNMLGELLKYLEEQNLKDYVNVLLIGDHGMVETSYKKVIHLDDYINTKTDLKYVFGITSMHVYTKYNTTQYVYKKLSKQSQKNNSHFKVYLKDNIPEDFHLKKSKRTGPILLVPDSGWVVLAKSQKVPYLVGKWERGDHGYSNKERLMNSGFYAFGPSFKSDYHLKTFEIVDLYSLLCSLLKLKIDERDGKYNRVKLLLKQT